MQKHITFYGFLIQWVIGNCNKVNTFKESLHVDIVIPDHLPFLVEMNRASNVDV